MHCGHELLDAQHLLITVTIISVAAGVLLQLYIVYSTIKCRKCALDETVPAHGDPVTILQSVLQGIYCVLLLDVATVVTCGFC